jgi:hypothetical protein
MVRYENRYDEYAYRIAYRELDPSVESIEEGKWITLNSDGKIVSSDGSKKSFLLIGSKRTGRDQISGKAVQKLAYLFGHFEISVSNYDATKTFGAMTPLVVDANGDLRPYVEATDKTYLICAYSLAAPSTDGYIRIIAID